MVRLDRSQCVVGEYTTGRTCNRAREEDAAEPDVAADYMSFVFFFQAEDGIRDIGVTGVQTCALPISAGVRCWPKAADLGDAAKSAAIRGLAVVMPRSRRRQPLPSRPGEFHPEPLTDPYVNLSIHTARVIARRLPPSAEPSGSSRFDPVGPCSTSMTCPLCSTGITPLHHYYGAVRPSPAHRYFRPRGWSRLCLSLSIAGQVLTFHTRARLSFAPSTCRMPLGQSQCIPQADPGRRVNPRFWHRLIRFRHFIDGSLALASLNRACRDHVPTFPQRSPPSLLTTAACGGLRSTPDCRPRRALLHLSYSCAWPFGPAMLVTQDPTRTKLA